MSKTNTTAATPGYWHTDRELLMDIKITATNSSVEYELPPDSVFKIRVQIASIYDEEIGNLISAFTLCKTEEDFIFMDKIAKDMLADSRFRAEDSDIIKFIFSFDEKGKIQYRTCGKLNWLLSGSGLALDAIEFMDVSDEKHNMTQFNGFLKECYSHRRSMRWKPNYKKCRKPEK